MKPAGASWSGVLVRLVLAGIAFGCEVDDRDSEPDAGGGTAGAGTTEPDAGGGTAGAGTTEPDAGDAAGAEPARGGAGGAPARGPEEECELTYTQGHGDVFVVFDGGLDWRIRSSFVADAGETLADPSRVCVVVPGASFALAESMGGAPTSGDYAFLGAAPGDSFWLLPQAPREGIPWFGVSTENVPLAIYMGDEIELAITEIEAPEGGSLSAWSSGTFGAPSVIFGSAAGKLVHSFSAGAHLHFNWGFTVAGRYSLRMEVAGRRGGVRESSTHLLRFLVEP